MFKLYRILDKNTGLFFTGDTYYPMSWTEKGKLYHTLGHTRLAVFRALSAYERWTHHITNKHEQISKRPNTAIIIYELNEIDRIECKTISDRRRK